jgi:5,10-methylenetetrahydromethanopterin reductase
MAGLATQRIIKDPTVIAQQVATLDELSGGRVGAKLSIAGTPEEWVEKIETDVLPSGFNHLIVAIADPYLVKSWSGMSIEGLPDTRAQLRLIEERVIPKLQ